LSRSRVHQILSALDDADDWDDEEDNYPPPPPYFYVGTEPVVLTDKDMDHSTVVLEPRFLDVKHAVVLDVGHLPVVCLPRGRPRRLRGSRTGPGRRTASARRRRRALVSPV
jgi:hypothetical protein